MEIQDGSVIRFNNFDGAYGYLEDVGSMTPPRGPSKKTIDIVLNGTYVASTEDGYDTYLEPVDDVAQQCLASYNLSDAYIDVAAGGEGMEIVDQGLQSESSRQVSSMEVSFGRHSKESNIEITRSAIIDNHIIAAMTPEELNTHLAAELANEPMATQGFDDQALEPAGPLGLEPELPGMEIQESLHSVELSMDERSVLQAILEQIVGGKGIRAESEVIQEWIPVFQEVIQKLRNPNDRTAAISQDAAQHLLEEQTPDLDPYAQFGLYKAAAGEEVPFEGVREAEYLPQPNEQSAQKPAQVSDLGDDTWEVTLPAPSSNVALPGILASLQVVVTGYDERAGVTSFDIVADANILNPDGSHINTHPTRDIVEGTPFYNKILEALNGSPEVLASLEAENAQEDLGYDDTDSIYDQQAGK